jgi:adenylyltransferase/sulfurtransferase
MPDVLAYSVDCAWCGTCEKDTNMDANDVREITPLDLAERLKRGDDFDLLDVREHFEIAIAAIPGAKVIPLGDLPDSLDALDRTREIIVMCRSGRRSADATRQLQAAGFTNVTNLAGGILRWSDDVDPTVAKY